ncbi:hypothetical protein AAG570_001484 [Ranatra chinensis]|uniref:Uncharacterized protein n=1 Tax=Ranatra chinensis TaxID=642074 RepID=A0ABD0Y8Z2_9HEMI
MTSNRRNMFEKTTKQETTEIDRGVVRFYRLTCHKRSTMASRYAPPSRLIVLHSHVLRFLPGVLSDRNPCVLATLRRGFDVYNIETAMPKIDLEAIETHLRAAREEERRNGDIQFTYAHGDDAWDLRKTGGAQYPILRLLSHCELYYRMTSKRRNMFEKTTKEETTKIGPVVSAVLRDNVHANAGCGCPLKMLSTWDAKHQSPLSSRRGLLRKTQHFELAPTCDFNESETAPSKCLSPAGRFVITKSSRYPTLGSELNFTPSGVLES